MNRIGFFGAETVKKQDSNGNRIKGALNECSFVPVG